jgi:hypothetical protein
MERAYGAVPAHAVQLRAAWRCPTAAYCVCRATLIRATRTGAEENTLAWRLCVCPGVGGARLCVGQPARQRQRLPVPAQNRMHGPYERGVFANSIPVRARGLQYEPRRLALYTYVDVQREHSS